MRLRFFGRVSTQHQTTYVDLFLGSRENYNKPVLAWFLLPPAVSATAAAFMASAASIDQSNYIQVRKEQELGTLSRSAKWAKAKAKENVEDAIAKKDSSRPR
jgi:hypothetical protein